MASGAEPAARESARFLLAWVALVLVPLTLSRGKVDYYLLPLYPALGEAEVERVLAKS